MKRFYKETAVDQGDGGHRILLDGRPMRTPAKAVLVVPTRALAEAIAAEWGAVPDKADINVSHLPLTRLAATGLDRVTSQRARVIDDTAKYGGSDMLCYRAGAPETLVKRQQETWQPLLDWADERYGARLIVVEGLAFVEQPADAVARLSEAVAAHSDLGLSALYNLTHISGSPSPRGILRRPMRLPRPSSTSSIRSSAGERIPLPPSGTKASGMTSRPARASSRSWSSNG
jgi:chaperone required for assembly of F1-ATPase